LGVNEFLQEPLLLIYIAPVDTKALVPGVRESVDVLSVDGPGPYRQRVTMMMTNN
jgi:hypothetical protein